jgi:hypothetical protein
MRSKFYHKEAYVIMWDKMFQYHVHCEKSLFVLASRQKIPVLRTKNPAVDTCHP